MRQQELTGKGLEAKNLEVIRIQEPWKTKMGISTAFYSPQFAINLSSRFLLFHMQNSGLPQQPTDPQIQVSSLCREQINEPCDDWRIIDCLKIQNTGLRLRYENLGKQYAQLWQAYHEVCRQLGLIPWPFHEMNFTSPQPNQLTVPFFMEPEISPISRDYPVLHTTLIQAQNQVSNSSSIEVAQLVRRLEQTPKVLSRYCNDSVLSIIKNIVVRSEEKNTQSGLNSSAEGFRETSILRRLPLLSWKEDNQNQKRTEQIAPNKLQHIGEAEEHACVPLLHIGECVKTTRSITSANQNLFTQSDMSANTPLIMELTHQHNPHSQTASLQPTPKFVSLNVSRSLLQPESSVKNGVVDNQRKFQRWYTQNKRETSRFVSYLQRFSRMRGSYKQSTLPRPNRRIYLGDLCFLKGEAGQSCESRYPI